MVEGLFTCSRDFSVVCLTLVVYMTPITWPIEVKLIDCFPAVCCYSSIYVNQIIATEDSHRQFRCDHCVIVIRQIINYMW